MTRLIFGFVFFSFIILAKGQGPGTYTIYLSDKKGTSYSLAHPEAFLSFRALERRNRQNIPVTTEDLPVSPVYIDSLHSLGLKIRCLSRWFNTVTAYTDDSLLADTLNKLSFVKDIRLVKPATSRKSAIEKWNKSTVESGENTSLIQLRMLRGDTLHSLGYAGKGMVIAVLDAGFYHVNMLPAFDSIRMKDQILGTRDFVSGNDLVYDDHMHGMNVLSILAGNIPGRLIGSAPAASYWLLRTEDTGSEYPIEEDFWTAGAEFADSAGADIISTSLGYYVFDDPAMNHTYHDMDGHTTTVARAATMAARRGMIVVASAGNERSKAWHYIITPADADSILAVGATDSSGVPAYFSSVGPSADGRIKPDVSAMGINVLFQGSNGTLVRGNGTSFSAPLISGMTACLWQAFPNAKAQEIIHIVRESASIFLHPNDIIGYGIPDYLLAYTLLRVSKQLSASHPLVYPNPFVDHVTLAIKTSPQNKIQICIYDLKGRIIYNRTFNNQMGNTLIIPLDLKNCLSSGLYILRVYSGQSSATIPIIKIKQ